MPHLFNFVLFFNFVFRTLKIGFIVGLVIFTTSANANSEISPESLKKHTSTLDKIEVNLKRHSLNENEIPDTIKQVTLIKSTATQCIASESLNIEKFKKNLESLGKPSKVELEDVKQKRSQLNKEIVNAEKLLVGCQVFILRSEEVLKNLLAEQQTLLSARLFAKGPNIKYLVLVNWDKPSLWLKSIHLFLLNDTGV